MIEIAYKKISRARHIKISVHRDGRCVVTMPPWVPYYLAQRFVAEKKEWIRARIAHFKTLPPPVTSLSRRKEFLLHKQRALDLALQRIGYFNRVYGFSFRDVTIRNQKTRWGSCSKRGALSFNYKIALLPSALADYIIVHELCHLKELNHSKRFWALVARTIPDHRLLRKKLRTLSLV